MRQYGEVVAWLSTAAPPGVSGATGLGTGGGAGVQSKAGPNGGQSVGSIVIQAGSNPSVGGSVTLAFAQTPPTLFVSPGDDGFGVLAVTGQGTTSVTISWAGQLQAGVRHHLYYEWAVSK